jgi:hypothetical protein
MPAKAGIHAFLSKMRKESASFLKKRRLPAWGKKLLLPRALAPSTPNPHLAKVFLLRRRPGFFFKKEALASAKTVLPTGFHPAQ